MVVVLSFKLTTSEHRAMIVTAHLQQQNSITQSQSVLPLSNSKTCLGEGYVSVNGHLPHSENTEVWHVESVPGSLTEVDLHDTNPVLSLWLILCWTVGVLLPS